jgi:hypothetical protein
VVKLTFSTLLALVLALLVACDEGLEPVPFQGISGAVTFVGTTPDSTDWVRVGAYIDLPETELDLLGFAGLTEPLILEGDSAGYATSLDPGLFQWVPVIWKQAGVPVPAGLRVLGWYTEGGGPFDTPGSVEVVADEETGEIEIVADFENALTIAEALEALK